MFNPVPRLFLPYLSASLLLLVLSVAVSTPRSAHAEPSPTVVSVAAQQQWVAGWRDTSPMLAGRTGAAVYAGDGVIHMVGGMGGPAGSDGAIAVQTMPDANIFLRTTEYTRVEPDGTLSPWSPGPRLNVERAFFSTISHKNYLYAVGGASDRNNKLHNSVERAQIKADGTLGDWVLEKTTLNNLRRCVKLAVIDGYIYAFGGYSGILLDTLERTQINPDGSLGEWMVVNDRMTVARYVHGVERVDDGVYQIGGHSKEGGEGIVDVGWSRVDTDGFFQPWSTISPLQSGRFSLATASHNGFLYAIAGLNGAAYIDSIERAQINEAGQLSKWEYTTPAPTRMSGANAVVIDERIYLLGGSDGNGYLRSAYYASFNEQGDIGFQAMPTEIEKHRAAITMREANKPAFPHSAVVIKHFKKRLYSYMQVREDSGNVIWLAAPSQDLKEGERVSFPNGTVMKNFHSKGLNRTFSYILFTREVRHIPGKSEAP